MARRSTCGFTRLQRSRGDRADFGIAVSAGPTNLGILGAWTLLFFCTACGARTGLQESTVGVDAALDVSRDAVDVQIDEPPAMVRDVPTDLPSPPPMPVDFRLRVNVDDALEAWLDGESLGTDMNWQHTFEIQRRLAPGRHVLAILGTDLGRSITGMIAVVEVDGRILARTGEPVWRAMASPPPGFQQPAFIASSWPTAVPCTDTTPWHGVPAALLAQGAVWVWNGSCIDFRPTGFRLEFTTP